MHFARCLPSLVLAACIAATYAVGAGSARPAAGGYLLVANKGDHTLSVVDVTQGKQLRILPENGITGHEVAASPDGGRAFVPIYGDSGVGRSGTDGRVIRVFDLNSGKTTGTIDFGQPVRPHCAVFGPRDGLLYVTTELLNAVSIIDPVSLKIVGSVPTGRAESHMLAISSDGLRGYTANVGSGTVSVLDLVGRKLVTVIHVAPAVQRISLSIDGKWAFTADQTALRLAVIDTATNEVARSVPLPGLGFGTAATPDGRWLLAAIPANSEMALIDLGLMKVVKTIAVPKAPQEILVSHDGTTAFVSCDQSKQVAVIDLSTRTVSKLINVGALDDGLAWAHAN
jgi:DNA-binding beta-propeller fold protein YncE